MSPSSLQILKHSATKILLLSILYFSFYGQTLKFSFVWDDRALIDTPTSTLKGSPWAGFYLSGNDMISTLKTGEVFAPAAFQDSFRPLSYLSYWMDYRFFGNNPKPFHFHNLILGFLLILAFWFLSFRWLQSSGGATATSLVLLASPLFVEPVSYITARTDLLAAFFCLLSTLAFTWQRKKTSHSIELIYLSLGYIFFLSALLSKESSIILPIALVPAFFLLRVPSPIKKTGALLVAIGVYLFVRNKFGFKSDIHQALAFLPFAFQYYVDYLRVLILPYDVSITRLPTATFTNAIVLSAAFIPCLVILITAAYRKSIQYIWLLLPFLILAACVFLSASFITFFASLPDRYIFIPLIFTILSLSCFMKFIAQEFQISSKMLKLGLVAYAITVGVSLLKSDSYIPSWQNQVSLLQENLRVNPNSFVAYHYASTLYLEVGEFEKAIPLLKQSLTLNSRYPRALLDLAKAYYGTQNYQNAETVLSFAISNRDFTEPLSVFFYLGASQLKSGKIKEGCASLEAAFKYGTFKIDDPDLARRISQCSKK